MDIHAMFERVYAEQFDTTAADIKSCRLINGSYNNLRIARAFRMFRAGYHAHQQDPLKLLGYLSRNGVKSAENGSAACFKSEPSEVYCIPVFIRGRDQ